MGLTKNDKVIIVGYTAHEEHMSQRVIAEEGICFTLMAMTHGWGQGYIRVYDKGDTGGKG